MLAHQISPGNTPGVPFPVHFPPIVLPFLCCSPCLPPFSSTFPPISVPSSPSQGGGRPDTAAWPFSLSSFLWPRTMLRAMRKLVCGCQRHTLVSYGTCTVPPQRVQQAPQVCRASAHWRAEAQGEQRIPPSYPRGSPASLPVTERRRITLPLTRREATDPTLRWGPGGGGCWHKAAGGGGGQVTLPPTGDGRHQATPHTASAQNGRQFVQRGPVCVS